MDGLFEYYIETEDMHLKYAKGEPSIKDKELHLYHELVWFLGGSSRFISGSVQRDLTPESIVVIPKEKFHRFRVDNGSEYVRCILGFRETPDTCELIRKVMTDVRILTKPDKKILYQFSQLTEAVKSLGKKRCPTLCTPAHHGRWRLSAGWYADCRKPRRRQSACCPDGSASGAR